MNPQLQNLQVTLPPLPPTSNLASTQTVTDPSFTIPPPPTALSIPRSKPEEKKAAREDSLHDMAALQVAGRPDSIAISFDIRITRGNRSGSQKVTNVTGAFPMIGLLDDTFIGFASDSASKLLNEHIMRRLLHEIDRIIRTAGTGVDASVASLEVEVDPDDDPRPQAPLTMPPGG